MNISIESPVKTLLNILKAVNVSMSEATIRITKEGISFRGMGASHIDLIDVNYGPTEGGFKKFEVDEDVKFGIRVDDILKIVKRFGDGKKLDQFVELKINNGEVKFMSQSKTFETRVLNAAEGTGQLPKAEWPAKFSIAREALLDALSDIALQSERVKIIIKDGKASLSGAGDKGSATVQLLAAQNVVGETETVYSLELVNSVVKEIDEDTVIVETGPNMPLKLTIGKILYFLAPQVKQE